MGVNVFVCRKIQKQGRPCERTAVRIQERSNMGCTVRFLLDGQEFERRVTRCVDDPARDLNADSPVGQALLVAGVGDEKQVEVPGGYVVVKVLGIRYEDA